MLSERDSINAKLAHPDPAWGFYHLMTACERDWLDAHLVATEHPLASQPGTQWDRWQKLHQESYRVE